MSILFSLLIIILIILTIISSYFTIKGIFNKHNDTDGIVSVKPLTNNNKITYEILKNGLDYYKYQGTINIFHITYKNSKLVCKRKDDIYHIDIFKDNKEISNAVIDYNGDNLQINYNNFSNLYSLSQSKEKEDNVWKLENRGDQLMEIKSDKDGKYYFSNLEKNDNNLEELMIISIIIINNVHFQWNRGL